MKYVEYSINEIKEKIKKNKEEKVTKTIVRIETTAGGAPRLIAVLEIGEDYIVGRGRKQTESEIFSFNQIASWRFGKYVSTEWNW